MRKNELRTARGYLDALILDNKDDGHWYIEGIVTPEISSDGKTAVYRYEVDKWEDGKLVKVMRESHQFRLDEFRNSPFPHVFCWQQCSFEDCYNGQMLYPLEGSNDYLLVGFNC